MKELEAAAHAHDVDAVIACFAPDIVVRSPITERIQFRGAAQVAELFRCVFEVVSDIQFYETVGDGDPVQVIFWRGRVGRHYLEEANLLRLDQHGRITEMTVFMRPVPGLLALTTALGAALARRRHPARARAIRVLAGTVAALYRAGEPAILALVAAGTRTDARSALPRTPRAPHAVTSAASSVGAARRRGGRSVARESSAC
jgi:ketosteroid isomerase-like protein